MFSLPDYALHVLHCTRGSLVVIGQDDLSHWLGGSPPHPQLFKDEENWDLSEKAGLAFKQMSP